MSNTLAHHAALTVDGRTIDQLLAFHRSVFGDARMENDGGDPATPATPPATTLGTPTATPAATTPPAAPPAATGKTWDPDAWDGKVESLPSAAQKIITDLRKADGDERVAKKTLDAIQKALNPDAEGEKVDPAKLAQQLAGKDATIRDLTIRSALTDALHTNSAKPIARAAILGDNVLGSLDPAADDFTTKVDEAVKAYLEKNPELKAARVAGSSSVNHAGGSGEGQHDIDAQIAEATKKGDHALAIRLKRQKAYTQQTT